MNHDIKRLIARAEAYAAHRGLSRSTVSHRLFSRYCKLDELEQGTASIRADILERALKRLSDLERAAGMMEGAA